MKQLRAAIVAVLLSMSLAVAVAGTASAAPSIPHSPSCTTWVDGWYGSVYSESPSGNLRGQAYALALYDSVTGASCNEFRAGFILWTTSGTETVSSRDVGLHWYPGGSNMGSDLWLGSVTVGTSPVYMNGYSYSGVPCGWTFYGAGNAFLANSHSLTAVSQVMSGPC